MLLPPLIIHPRAAAEAQAARTRYAEGNEAAGDAFLAEYDRVLDEIEAHPERWPSHLHGTHRLLFRRPWPVAVVYRIRLDSIYVLAVAHHRRRPGYWMSRR